MFRGTALGPLCGGLVALALLGEPAIAETDSSRRHLFFSGVDLSTLSAFGWAGVDTALTGPRDQSGPIMRGMGGLGRYDYKKSGAPGGSVVGNVVVGELMAGWRQIGRAACFTLLGGFSAEDHMLDTPDPTNKVQGTEAGAKIAAEMFWRPSRRSQIEASLAYATAFEFYRARIAGGYMLWRGIVVGPEAEMFGNEGSDQVRLGLFASDVGWREWNFKAALGALHDREQLGAYGRFGVDLNF